MISQNLKEKICNIKKIKSKNYLKKYFTFRTFYKDYTLPKRNFNSPRNTQNNNNKYFLSLLRSKNMKLFKEKSKSTNRLLILNPDYLFYSPYVTKMMQDGIESTKYDSTKYTLSPNEELKNIKLNSKSKKYFGISGDTPLIMRDSIYSNNSRVSKTLSKFNSFSEKNIFERTSNNNLDKIIDNERKTAEEFFMDSFRNKNLKMFSKKNEKNFYDKYNINNKLTLTEEIKINQVLERSKKNNLNIEPIFKSINSEESFDNYQTQTFALDKQYKNPYNSGKEMKIKNQMMKIIENLNVNFQCEKYQKEYNTICELNNQKNRMPEVKVVPKKKLKIFKGFNAEQYLKNLDSNESYFEENNRKKFKKNKKSQIYFFKKPQTIYARGADLKEVELKVEYVPCMYHPYVRTKTAICFNEEKGEIFLYGGIEGKKLADLWQINFSQIKSGWQKLYEPTKNNDYENEPLPRFGHTLHFYNNKLYLIGGEFTDWIKNDLKEGIMCVYDIKNKIWDMMKYKYDMNWYNKKKEEKRATIKQHILSFQEISNTLEHLKEKDENKDTLDDINTNSIKTKYRNKTRNSKLELNQLFNKNNIKKYNTRNNNKYNINTTNKEPNKIKLIKSFKSSYNLNSNSPFKSEETKYIFPPFRRYHISLLIGNHIFLYGGETPFNKCLNDCWIYDLISQKWSLIEYIGRYPPPLCCHSACLVLEQNQLINEALNVYYKPPSEKKTLRLLKTDGVFFFGGYNENKKPTNLFFRMVIGVKPVLFEIPETKGLGPSPRIQASMNFNSENNLIVIHGGRNELKNEVYNDIILLDMENMCWIHTKFWGEKPLARSEHKAVVISNKLFIFGGVNNKNFINFDFTIFNLDFFAQKYALKNDI